MAVVVYGRRAACGRAFMASALLNGRSHRLESLENIGWIECTLRQVCAVSLAGPAKARNLGQKKEGERTATAHTCRSGPDNRANEPQSGRREEVTTGSEIHGISRSGA